MGRFGKAAVVLLAVVLLGAAPEIKKVESLQGPFLKRGYAGCVLICDLEKDEYMSGDPDRCTRRFCPASTFKIFNSLVALETDVALGPDFVIQWDGRNRGRPEADKDLTMREAMDLSAVWYYQELARRIGKERMHKYVDLYGYGNRDLACGIDTFWLKGCLEISPLEQVELLKSLYRRELPFKKENQDAVYSILPEYKGDGFRIKAKTGTSRKERFVNCWYVGYLELEKGKTYAFATNFESDSRDFEALAEARLGISLEAFQALGLIGPPGDSRK